MNPNGAVGVCSLQSRSFPQNTAILALHERHKFRRIGTRERVGQLDVQ